MKREQDGAIITQLDYPTCEKLGLLKMDFLGLRNLTVIDDAVGNVKANRGLDVDIDAVTLDDEATYRLLARGDTLGVFQLDGGPMRALLRQMGPTAFGDIAAVLALYRPGPMAANAHIDYAERKNARQAIKHIHPELAAPLAEILDETYGLVVYQEQVQAIARKVAGYTLGQADLLRRAMGKKKKAELDAQLENFTAGMKAGGFSQSAIDALWGTLLPFCDYGFNKSHTAGYGLVSYWTAYLKANFPAEYMAALLTSVKDDKDKMAVYLAECRRMGIRVLPPCVNESDANFTPTGTDIRFGLTAIRNVGANVVSSVVATRQAKGAFADFGEFLKKVDAVVCNKRTIEGLIKGGAFDSMNHPRRGLINSYEAAVDAVVDTKRAEAIGQFDLFGSLGETEGAPIEDAFAVRIPEGEWDKKVLLQFEREMLGLYVSDHPLFGLEHILAGAADMTVAAVQAEGAGEPQTITLAGILSSVNRRVTKAGAPWANAVLEDLEGSIEVMFFPATYAQVALNIAEDAIVAIKGRTDAREDTVKLIASELTVLDTTEAPRGPVNLRIEATRCTPPMVDRLKDVLSAHPGTTEVHLQLQGRNNLRLVIDHRVTASPALMGDLKALLGPTAISA
jgi:DNA polymerase-3 subunit alpha